LSLDENQFLNPLTQKEFLRMFSTTLCNHLLIRSDEGLAYQFLSTYLSMMRLFFRLPALDGKNSQETSIQEEARVLDRLLMNFFLEKEKYQKSLYVSYKLTGSVALKRWIKKEVEKGLTRVGRKVVEIPTVDQRMFLRYLQVSNDPDVSDTNIAIFLPLIPQKKEIQQALRSYLGSG